jgi:hypothetical protein
VALVLVLAACGSGQNPVVEGSAGPSTTSTTGVAAAGDTLPPTGDSVVTGDSASAGGTDAGGADPAGDGGTATDPGASGSETPAANPFAPPTPGSYTFHTTGTAPSGLLGGQQPVDEQSITTITALSADTVRQSSTSAGMTQTTDLRYEAGRVALLLLEVSGQGVSLRFPSADGITFVPLPPTAGQAWNGQLHDESGQLTADFSGTTAPGERITIMGGAVDAFVVDATIHIYGTYSGIPIDITVALRAWIDPALRTQVRTHQVTSGMIASDTTSELVGFTPAP